MAFLFLDCWRRRIDSMLNNVFLRISSLDLDVLKYFMAFFLSLVEIFSKNGNLEFHKYIATT